MSRRFRAWDKVYKEYTTDKVLLAPDGRVISRYGFDSWDSFLTVNDVVIEFNTGLKDKNGDKEIYEYDIIDGEGNIIGNYHETPELLKDKTNLLIQGFGTKTWLTTYQEAVERGCHDA